MVARNSLIWKLILPIPVMVGVLILGAWIFIPSWIAQNTVEDATAAARHTVGEFRALREYYTKNVITRLAQSGGGKAVLDYQNEPGAIPLPATMLHEISAMLEKNDTHVALFSPYPFPNRKDRKLDPFQAEAWRYLNTNPDAVFTREETVNGRHLVRVATADRMTAQACVNCHNSHPQSPKTDWKLNDVRGVIEVDEAIEVQLAKGRILSNTVLIALAGSGLLLSLIFTVLARGVSLPLVRLGTAMGRLAAGDKTIEIAGRGRRDEIGAMAGALDIFRRNSLEIDSLQSEQQALRERNEGDRRSALKAIAARFHSTVMAIIEEVRIATAQAEDTAEELSKTARDLDTRATASGNSALQASENVQSIAAGMEELAYSIDEIGRQATNSTRLAEEAVETTRNTDTSMHSLTETAQKIGEVVSLINNIASQTNLLALNATIEAARAGEAGKGFAVVASEVKSLANQTAKATEDIANQVRAIQDATQDTARAINEIGSRILAINEVAASIAAAVEEQGAATRGIADNVHRATSGADDVSANIRIIQDAASHSNHGTAEFLEMIRTLAGNAQKLSDDTETFIIQLQAG